MMQAPKLRWPINTYQLGEVDRMVLLAYDIVWRLNSSLVDSQCSSELRDDVDINLAQLGGYIETKICGGDLALRFVGCDSETTAFSAEDIFNIKKEGNNADFTTEDLSGSQKNQE